MVQLHCITCHSVAKLNRLNYYRTVYVIVNPFQPLFPDPIPNPVKLISVPIVIIPGLLATAGSIIGGDIVNGSALPGRFIPTTNIVKAIDIYDVGVLQEGRIQVVSLKFRSPELIPSILQYSVGLGVGDCKLNQDQ